MARGRQGKLLCVPCVDLFIDLYPIFWIVKPFCALHGAARNKPMPTAVPLGHPHPMLVRALAAAHSLFHFSLSASTVSGCRGRDITETAQRLTETPAWLAAPPLAIRTIQPVLVMVRERRRHRRLRDLSAWLFGGDGAQLINDGRGSLACRDRRMRFSWDAR